MSANNAVTVLRSPSVRPRASMAAGQTRERIAPHASENLAPVELSNPQFAQRIQPLSLSSPAVKH
jgi:hypothetical protein